MKKKYRRRLALLILAVTFSAISPIWKLLIVLPCLINLVIEFDDFNYNWKYGGENK